MKRSFLRVVVLTLVLSILLSLPVSALSKTTPFDIRAKSAILMDYNTGTILFEKNPHEKLPVASVTKIMTILLIIEAIENGRLSLDEKVMVSEYASSMGGSQVFLAPGEKIPVSAMLKAIIVASANDASVAMAEKVAGTHEAFVARMNERAEELGMKNTNFVNCTGLPADGHYTTAYDVALMSRELMKHQLFFKWSTIWNEYLEECENKTQMTNTNRLIRFYDGCDGIKTGSTNEALYCLSASAKRGNMRLISVVLGAPTSKVRFNEAAKLMDYGFANYESVLIVKKEQIIKQDVRVTGGKETQINGIAAKDFAVLCKKGESKGIETKINIEFPIKAPVLKGQKIGEIIVAQNGKSVGSVDIISDRNIEKASIFDYFIKLLHQWAKKDNSKDQ